MEKETKLKRMPNWKTDQKKISRMKHGRKTTRKYRRQDNVSNICVMESRERK